MTPQAEISHSPVTLDGGSTDYVRIKINEACGDKETYLWVPYPCKTVGHVVAFIRLAQIINSIIYLHLKPSGGVMKRFWIKATVTPLFTFLLSSVYRPHDMF